MRQFLRRWLRAIGWVAETEMEAAAERYRWIQARCFEVRLSYREGDIEHSFGFDAGPDNGFLDEQIDLRRRLK